MHMLLTESAMDKLSSEVAGTMLNKIASREMTLQALIAMNISQVHRLPTLFDLDTEQKKLTEVNVLNVKKTPKIRAVKREIMQHFVSAPCKEIIWSMFWVVFVNSFTTWFSKRNLSADLHKKITRCYHQVFVALAGPSKDLVIDVLTVLVGIQVYMIFNSIFKSDLKSFGARFLTECIHFTQ